MSEESGKGFFAELKRRNVYRVAIAYIVGAWLIIQVADTVFPYFGISADTISRLIILLAIGFLPALILSWLFEWTPAGIEFDEDRDRRAVPADQGRRKIDYAIIAMLTIAVAIFSYDRFVSPIGQGAVRVTANANPAIAVMPFQNRSAREEDTYFVDGIHDDIVTSLARIGSLSVISKTTVEQFRNSEKSIGEIGDELGVTAILEGGVQRAANQVRVNVQLIDVASNSSQWAGTYERQLTATNVFSIQSEISDTIARALQTELLPEERARIAKIPTENLEAYESYLLGNHQLRRRREGPIDRALEHFQTAVALDPEFALGYVGIADSYLLLYNYTSRTWEDLRPKATEAARKAVSLDPDLGEAYASLAMIYAESGELEAAEPLFEKALALNPGYATAHQWYSEFLTFKRDDEGALRAIEVAIRLDPLSPIINHGYASILRRFDRLEEAEQKWLTALEVDPEFARAYQGLAALYFSHLGRLDEAARLAHKAIMLNSDNSTNYALLANIFLNLGDDDEAERWLEEAARREPQNFFTVQVTSELHAVRQEFDKAADIARPRLQRNPRQGWHVAMMVNFYSANDDLGDAVTLLETSYPELVSDDGPVIRESNVPMALILVETYQQAGLQEKADLLLDGVQAFYEVFTGDTADLGAAFDVRYFTLLGDYDRAIVELQNLVDSGWRRRALYMLNLSEALEVLRDKPEFVRIRNEVIADLARQRDSALASLKSETI